MLCACGYFLGNYALGKSKLSIQAVTVDALAPLGLVVVLGGDAAGGVGPVQIGGGVGVRRDDLEGVGPQGVGNAADPVDGGGASCYSLII